eukprot:TRINITY_DN470_c0_g6_i1.p1 TRINITY_DN470_c0_g6~~TRINITY_DN470_c0_g6_i1.p1  ORF type:complete len:767 (-),score=153.63 TRINITY_DN470_c0_g6_i1:47-2029(-)
MSIDLIPLAASLKLNTYFKGLELRNVEHREASSAFASVLSENRVLTRVVCSNCCSDVTEVLGTALQQNLYNKVSILDFSQNKITVKGIEALASFMQTCPHLIQVINMNDVGMNGPGLQALTNAWTINWGLSLGIEELNISNNQLSTASPDFIAFMSTMRKYSKLRRLGIANTSIAVGSLILELGFLKLTYLDFSDNRFDKLTQSNIAHFCEGTKTLETIRLANTGLGSQVITRLLQTLFSNESLNNLSIDISRNAIGPQGISSIAQVVKNATLNTFDLSDNGILEKGCIELIKSIKSVQKLILDKNFGREGKESGELADALGSFVKCHPEVYHLSIAGTSSSKIGKYLKSFFCDLEGNTSLEELDFSGNGIGDAVFSVFSNALAHSHIKAVRCDNNLITYCGYVAMKRSILKTTYFSKFEFPVVDYEADTRTKSKYLEVLVDIISEISKRDAYQWKPNVFDFDIKWKTPLAQRAQPLLVVPQELALLSSKLYDGPPPTIPPEEIEEQPPPTSRSNFSSRASKKSTKFRSPRRKKDHEDPPPPHYVPSGPAPNVAPPPFPPPDRLPPPPDAVPPPPLARSNPPPNVVLPPPPPTSIPPPPDTPSIYFNEAHSVSESEPPNESDSSEALNSVVTSSVRKSIFKEPPIREEDRSHNSEANNDV